MQKRTLRIEGERRGEREWKKKDNRRTIQKRRRREREE